MLIEQTCAQKNLYKPLLRKIGGKNICRKFFTFVENSVERNLTYRFSALLENSVEGNAHRFFALLENFVQGNLATNFPLVQQTLFVL